MDNLTMQQEENTNSILCSKCGATLTEKDVFCSSCGSPTQQHEKQQCKKCGTELEASQEYCHICGQKKNEIVPQEPVKDSKKRERKSKKKWIIIAVAIIAVALFSSLFSSSEESFDKRYASISYESWCEVASDGTWIRIDTNPENIDSDNLVFFYSEMTEANNQIEKINKDLGFSSALFEKMCGTTALQGRQSDENEKYKVSWSYHPDKGLEVLYEIKN